MWDGREDLSLTNPIVLDASLQHQANDATLGHAQAAMSVTSAQAQNIAAFQENIFTAQQKAQGVGSTSVLGANGGPVLCAHVV